MSEGDVGRLFGRFSWNQYSPAGSLERNGFFLRQSKRNGLSSGWSSVWQARWIFAAIAGVFAAIAIAARLL